MPEVLVHNEADQAQIAQIHADATILVAAEEVAQQRLPWSSLISHRPETPRRRFELARWHAQLQGDIHLFLELRSELQTMSSEDIASVEGSGRRMIDALWKLID